MPSLPRSIQRFHSVSALPSRASAQRSARQGFVPRVRRGAAGLALAVSLTLAGLAGAVSVGAQNAPSLETVRLKQTPALRGPFVYWFTNADRDMSTRQPLPNAGADGLLTIPIPADFRQPDALLNVLDVKHNLIARLPVKSGSPADENAGTGPSGPNLALNGDFAQGAEHWTMENAGKASATSQFVTGAELPAGAGGKIARLDVEAVDKEVWHAQFYQAGLDMANDTPYTLTFWGRADRERSLLLVSQLDNDDYHNTGLTSRVGLGTQWRKYTVAFTVAAAQPAHNRVGFLLGNLPGRVELAGITVKRGVTPRTLGPNLLLNTAFAANADHWQFQAAPPAEATMQMSGDAALPLAAGSKILHFQIGRVGANVWDVQLLQFNLPLEPEKTYTLSFWGRADRNRAINARTASMSPDAPGSGLDARISLTPEWRKFAYIFTTADTGRDGQEFALHMGDTAGVVEVAGLALQPGAANTTPANTAALPVLSRDAFTIAYKPGVQADEETGRAAGGRAHRSHPLVGTWQSFHKDVGLTGKEYQRYRFVFDPNGSGSLQVTQLTENADAPPKSQQTEPFKWQLIEGGPHVSIGSNVYTWAIEKESKDSPKQKLTLKNYEGKTYILFRQ